MDEGNDEAFQTMSDSDSMYSSFSYEDTKYWKGLKKFTGEKLYPKMVEIKESFEQFKQLASQLTTIWKEKGPAASKTHTLSKKITSIQEHAECNPMTK